jgi:hypothetical protein
MYRSLTFGLLLVAMPCHAESQLTLTTQNYVVVVTRNCEQGVLVCGDVTYEGANRRTGKSIRLNGTDVFRYCPGDHGDGEGKMPCRHDGYRFRNGNVEYNVWIRGITGGLAVYEEFGKRHADGTRQRRTVVEEEGQWAWSK